MSHETRFPINVTFPFDLTATQYGTHHKTVFPFSYGVGVTEPESASRPLFIHPSFYSYRLWLNNVFPGWAEVSNVEGSDVWGDIVDPSAGVVFLKPGEDPPQQYAEYGLARLGQSFPSPLTLCWGIGYVTWTEMEGGGWEGSWTTVWYNPDNTQISPPLTGWLTYPANADAGGLTYDTALSESYIVSGAGFNINATYDYYGHYLLQCPAAFGLKTCSVWKDTNWMSDARLVCYGTAAPYTWIIFLEDTPDDGYYYCTDDTPVGATWSRATWALPMPTVTAG